MSQDQDKGIDIRLAVRVTRDGHFEGTQRLFGSDVTGVKWIGTVDEQFRLNITRSWQATCPSESREGQSHLVGSIIETKQGLELRVGGTEEWCPKQGCTFRVAYALVKL